MQELDRNTLILYASGILPWPHGSRQLIERDYLMQPNNTRIVSQGLSEVLKRPHNIGVVKDDLGNIISHYLEVVYTPFTPDKIIVKASPGELAISVGTSDEGAEDDPSDEGNGLKVPATCEIYHGISTQGFSVKFKMSDTIDSTKVVATAKHGILRIDMPVKKESLKAVHVVKISE